jgi:hypothetical protein
MSQHITSDFTVGRRVVVESDPALGTRGLHGEIIRIVEGDLHFPVHVQLDRGRGLHIYNAFQLEFEQPTPAPRTGKRRRKRTL